MGKQWHKVATTVRLPDRNLAFTATFSLSWQLRKMSLFVAFRRFFRTTYPGSPCAAKASVKRGPEKAPCFRNADGIPRIRYFPPNLFRRIPSRLGPDRFMSKIAG
jgi:hypothetical protein